MGLSARIPVGLDDNAFIPKIYSANVLQAVKNKLVVVPQVNHAYQSDLVRGDIVYIPKTNVVTATEVTIGTEGVIKNPFATAEGELTVNQYYEAPVVVDYMSTRQTQVDLVGNSQLESAYALSKVMDTSLCDLFSTLNGSTAGNYGVGTDGSTITDTVLVAAVEDQDEADAPEEGRVWIFDPSVKADLLSIDKFVRMDYFAGDTIPTGGFRKDVYGAPILITNNLTVASTGNYAAYMHRDAMAIVIQEDMVVDRVEQPLKHQLTVNTTCLWGVALLRGDWGIPIFTRKA